MRHVIALFGEAERGAFHTAHVVRDLAHLAEAFGHPPRGSQGLFFAVQALLFQRELIFFRVEEEGFSEADYHHGFKHLKEKAKRLHALCLPGVGDGNLLMSAAPICDRHRSVVLTTQKDLYDFLTNR